MVLRGHEQCREAAGGVASDDKRGNGGALYSCSERTFELYTLGGLVEMTVVAWLYVRKMQEICRRYR